MVNCLCNNIFFFHLQARDRFKSSTLFAFHWIFMLANNCWKGIYLILIFLISDTCPMGTFLCQNTTICLPQKNWCDQEIQCPYGDDEQNCCRFIIFIFHLSPQKKGIDYKKNNGLNILLFARDTFVLAQKYHQTASFSVKKQIKFKI